MRAGLIIKMTFEAKRNEWSTFWGGFLGEKSPEEGITIRKLLRCACAHHVKRTRWGKPVAECGGVEWKDISCRVLAFTVKEKKKHWKFWIEK